MTRENLIRLHKRFTILSEGKFNERTFDFELTADDPDNSGRTHMGRMTPERIELIRSDAKRHKLDMEQKYPFLAEQGLVQEASPVPDFKCDAEGCDFVGKTAAGLATHKRSHNNGNN
jgi:hypothetical protein